MRPLCWGERAAAYITRLRDLVFLTPIVLCVFNLVNTHSPPAICLCSPHCKSIICSTTLFPPPKWHTPWAQLRCMPQTLERWQSATKHTSLLTVLCCAIRGLIHIFMLHLHFFVSLCLALAEGVFTRLLARSPAATCGGFLSDICFWSPLIWHWTF